MHILIIPSSYPAEDAPLRSTFFKEQAIALKEDGNKVGVIYSETRRITGINLNTLKKNHFQVKEYVEDGINTIRLHGWNILMMRNSLGINLWIKQSLILFNKYIKKYGKPDIIHVHCGLYGGIVAKLIKQQHDIPYVITEHSSIVMNHLLDDYHKKLLKEAYNTSDKLISVSRKLKEGMKVYTKKEIVVIPNIVDTAIFKYEANQRDSKFKFVSVCMLKSDKNIELLLRAFENAFKNNEQIGLMVIGDGPEKYKLESVAEELGIKKQVEFLGAVERKDLSKYLQKASAFALPSNYETFGVAYIEALACGLPIITTKCGGPEDFYEEKLGYIIPKGDMQSLSSAMRDMVINYDRFKKDEISKYIKEKFSKKVIVERIKKVYLEIIN
jgi:glycosyltransferase involved in cell wall biosynthesis